MSEALPTAARILVIRGGAIGDFILTLPAIRLLRENFPGARLEILGYKHIIALAEQRYYADETRSIEYGPVAAFFARNAPLDEELAAYFGGFQQIVSYLYDPDGIFNANLRRAGAKNILHAFRKLDDSDHVAHQLARPLESLALYLEDAAARIYPSASDQRAAQEFLGPLSNLRRVAIHPGSGSTRKNWPLERWIELAQRLTKTAHCQILVVGGEADHAQLAAFEALGERVALRIARDLPLCHLASVFQQCQLFIGHDSGVSHLAAAVDTPSLLLFGATDPDVWKPANRNVTILDATATGLGELEVENVYTAAIRLLGPR